MDTHIGHKFRIKVEGDDSIEPIDITITTSVQSEVVTFNETWSSLAVTSEVEYERQQSAQKIEDILKRSKRPSTKKVVNDAVKSCADMRANSEEYFKCVATGVKPRVSEIEKSSAETTTLRNTLSTHLRNYTCKDMSLHTSSSVSTEVYSDPLFNHGQEVLIHTLLAKTDVNVWMVDNFITAEESDILLKFGQPRLVRATVSGEDGTSVVSENRKAQQAVYDSHTRNKDADPLWYVCIITRLRNFFLLFEYIHTYIIILYTYYRPLFKRILAITNHRTNYGLGEEGQEHFAIIQYNPTDEYTPHCDGSCDGMKHMKGGRVATAVMYLKQPDVGGGTIFTNTNLHVKPRNNTVVFFSYRAGDGTMDDNRYTEHSGCPVVEGEKWIATFWMREGVSKTDPWTNFDPNGRRMHPERTLNDTTATTGDDSSDSEYVDTEALENASLLESYVLYLDQFLVRYIHTTFLPVTDFVFQHIKNAFYKTEATARVYDLIEDQYLRSLAILFPNNPGFMGSVLLTTVPVLSGGLLFLITFTVWLLGGFRKTTRGHRMLFRPLEKAGPDDYHRVVAGGLNDRTGSLPLADRLQAVEHEDGAATATSHTSSHTGEYYKAAAAAAAALEEGRQQLDETNDDLAEGAKPVRRGRKSFAGESSTLDYSAADEPSSTQRSKTPKRAPVRRQGRTSGFANDESPFVPATGRRSRSKTPGSARKRS